MNIKKLKFKTYDYIANNALFTSYLELQQYLRLCIHTICSILPTTIKSEFSSSWKKVIIDVPLWFWEI